MINLDSENEFDGVFRFTNATSEDFIALWNNKEYIFPAQTCCPILIPNETSENVQEIRKRFAFKLATREFYKGKVYKQMKEQGNGLPPTFDEKVLEPWINECLTPLPIAKAVVTEVKKVKETFKGSKAISDNTDLNTAFKDEEIISIGKQVGE